MAITQYNKNDLISKLRGYKVPQTESKVGEVSKDQIIKVMTKDAMPPMGNQMSQQWDRRIYNKRNPFFDNRERKTVKDIFQEAASQTAQAGLRLDLKSIDAEQAHCKLDISRFGKDYIADIYYPNVNGNISVIIKDQNNSLKEFETTTDDENYSAKLGESIIQVITDLAKPDQPANFDEMMYNDLDASKPATTQTEDGLNPDVGFMGEAVSWQLGRDMKETRRILMEFGPEDFAAEPDAGQEDVSQDINQANAAGEQMTNPVPGNETAGGEQDEEDTYTNFATQRATILKNGITDHMAEIIASSADKTPVILGRDKQLHGFSGIADMPDMEIIKAFGKLFGFISDASKSEPGKPAPETATDVRLPTSKWEELFTALEDDYSTPEHFKEQLGKILPDMFDSQGNMHNPAAELANLELPNDIGPAGSISNDDQFSVAEPAPSGPATGGGEDIFGDLASDIEQGNAEFQPDETPDDTSRYDQIFQNIQ